MRRYLTSCIAVVAMLCAGPAFAQGTPKAKNVPEMQYESVPNFLKFPPGVYLGEAIGVATNSKGNIFVYSRTGAGSELFEFDPNGTYIREIGDGYFGGEFSHSVRVDAQDNIWTVDEGSNTVVKWSPAGKVLMVLGHRREMAEGAIASAGGTTPPATKYAFGRVTDVSFDPQGNIFVSDGYVNHRVVKYDKNGRFVAQVGSERPGSEPSQFSTPHGIAVDLQGNVYVSDRANNRIQVLDNNLVLRNIYDNIGVSWTVCISPGPHQYLFTSNSNPNGNAPGTWENFGEIYKMELDGRILAKFGRAGKDLGGFQVVHMIDCRNPDTPIVAEIEAWRVQKLLLKPLAATKVSSAGQ